MASEASTADQTTDGTEDKKVIAVVKIAEEESASQPKETGESEGLEKPNIEETTSSITIETHSKESIEDKKDRAPTAEEGKEEDEADEAPASGILEHKKDDIPVVGEAKKEDEEVKASGSEAVGDNEGDASVAEVVKEEAGIDKPLDPEQPGIEASEKEPEEKSIVTAEESSSEAVPKLPVESELSLFHESDQVRQEPEVSERVAEIAKTTGEPSDISTDQTVASATTLSEEQLIAPTVTESAPNASGELEDKHEAPITKESVEASKDETGSNIAVEAVCEVLKKGSDVKETGSSSAVQALDTCPGDPAEVSEAKAVGSGDAFPVSTEKADGDVGANGCTKEVEDSAQDAAEVLVKDVTDDTSIPPSITVTGSERADTAPVSDGAELVVKLEISAEEQKEDETLETDTVEESKEVKALETALVEEQIEEKAIAVESAFTAAKETRDLSGPTTEVTKAPAEKDVPSEDGDKVVEEQRDLGGSDSAAKVIEACLEKEKSTEVSEKVAEDPKDESVKGDTSVVQTSRDIALEGSTTESTDVPIKEPVGTPEEAEKKDIGSIQKDETEEKKDETEKSGSQDVVESSKDGVASKIDVGVQKSESPAKPKSLISKVKQSIVKVRKAIIGKSPSLKTTTGESKDDL